MNSNSFLFIVRLVVTGKDSDLGACIDRHQTTTISNVDHIGHVVDDHHDSGAGARPLRAYLLAWHGVLGPTLGHLDQVDKAALTLYESTDDGLLGELGEVLILNDEIVEVVTQVVGTGGSSVAIEDSEEADLRPLNVEVLFALRLEDVEDDRNAIFVVISDNSLISVSSVRFNQAALLL